MSGLDNTSYTTTKVSANYTATANDTLILVTTGAGAITITIPDASKLPPGHNLMIRRDATGAGLVTATPAAGLVNGAANLQVGAASTITTAELYSDGTNWFSLGVSV